MRRTSPTQNRNRRQSAVSVSLFPFLAVLICTMGALILLLVVITHQARLQAAQLAAAEESKRATALKESREDVQWRIELLKESREKTEAELAEARLTLGHVEDHARRLQSQLARLEATLAELDRAGVDDRHQRARLEDELQRVRAEIAVAGRELADARRDAEHRARSYAIVPYHGPNETRRRPIYIECTAEAVILQPEGIRLTERHFAGPMGPGNPLAAALRAKREYLLTQGAMDPEKAGEPYPLLLVRPEGIEAYYAARAAMHSWASDFGYELVGTDWKLDFRPPDAELGRVMREAIESARVGQARLAAAAPRHYGRSQGRATYRVAPTLGGVVRDGLLPGEPASGGSADGSPPTFGRSSGSNGSGLSDAGRSGGGQMAPHYARPEGAIGGRPPRELPPGVEGQSGPAPRPGEWRPNMQSGGRRSTSDGHDRPGHKASMAKNRGQNWGLPDAARGSVPITRPIKILCHHDRLVIVPERGMSGGRTIPLKLRTERSVDEFLSAVWSHMESWGLAGNGMYWRPLLKVDVAPGGERRFIELRSLLEGSGLTLQQHNE